VYDFTEYIDEHRTSVCQSNQLVLKLFTLSVTLTMPFFVFSAGGARRVFDECGTDATRAYADEKKHDEDLLDRKVPDFLLGYIC